MSNDALRSEVERLREALAEVSDLDPQTAQAMRQVAADIQRALGSDAGVEGEAHGIRQRIDALVLDFESTHPRLTQILSKVTDLLSNMGI